MLTYAICTRNRADSLKRAVDSIIRAEDAHKTEVLVLDNGSTDHTPDVVRSFGEQVRGLHLVEPSIVRSRIKLLESATHDFVCFVDDDNELCAGHVDAALRAIGADRDVAAVGGFNIGRFDQTPPAWLDDFRGYLAIGGQGASEPVSEGVPHLWTSGMVVRRRAIIDLMSNGFKFVMGDRSGDTELSYALRLCGWKLNYDQRMQMLHHIPSTRSQYDKFSEFYADLHRRNGYLTTYLETLNGVNEWTRIKRSLGRNAIRSTQAALRLSLRLALPMNPTVRQAMGLHKVGLQNRTKGLLQARASDPETWRWLFEAKTAAR